MKDYIEPDLGNLFIDMKRCELCGGFTMVQAHHIVHGRGKRKQCETPISLIYLCWECHHGTNGVHGKNGHDLDMKLKKKLQQEYFDMGKSEAEVRQLMGGKLY